MRIVLDFMDRTCQNSTVQDVDDLVYVDVVMFECVDTLNTEFLVNIFCTASESFVPIYGVHSTMAYFSGIIFQ